MALYLKGRSGGLGGGLSFGHGLVKSPGRLNREFLALPPPCAQHNYKTEGGKKNLRLGSQSVPREVGYPWTKGSGCLCLVNDTHGQDLFGFALRGVSRRTLPGLSMCKAPTRNDHAVLALLVNTLLSL